MSERNLTLLTDYYEFTMSNGYFLLGRQSQRAAFDVFYRENPQKAGFSIFGGLQQIIDFLLDMHFTDADIEYLRSFNAFDEKFLDYLRHFKFTGDVYAFPEGTVMSPGEPIITVVAPIIEAQLVETFILNQFNHQSNIVTKTNRIVRAAKGRPVVEFGCRRAQNADAAIYGARAAMLGGAVGTSTVLAGQIFGMPVAGTHAHSWIMSFKTELEAFRTYAKYYPDNCLLLVDTYDTLQGVGHAIQVFKEMREAGVKSKLYGIRLDSGDLAYLTKKARVMLDEAGSCVDDLSEIFLAGGFGCGLNPDSAVAIGMLPSAPKARKTPIGNAALAGAATLLLHPQRRESALRLARNAHLVELGGNAEFSDRFIDSMAFVPV